MKPLRLAVLGSGKGSNYRAIAEAISEGNLNAEVVIVLSDVEEAGILSLAAGFGHRSGYFCPGPRRTRMGVEEEAALALKLVDAGIDFVVLAGFMRMIKAPLLEAFPRRIINIHPSLLPAFPGLDAWKQALEGGAGETGCTVHFVDEGMDTGEIILQERVPILGGDTSETLHARIQDAEHRIYPAALRQLAAERLTTS